jgi:hypothetical protein
LSDSAQEWGGVYRHAISNKNPQIEPSPSDCHHPPVTDGSAPVELSMAMFEVIIVIMTITIKSNISVEARLTPMSQMGYRERHVCHHQDMRGT